MAKLLNGYKIAGFKVFYDDYIAKPFNIEELHFWIDMVLNRKMKLTKK